MSDYRVGFVGCGNMGRSLIGGLIADGMAPERIVAADADPDQLASLRQRYAVQSAPDNRALVEGVDLVVLAVKPQVLRQVAEELAPLAAGGRRLFVSIAAGIRTDDLGRWLGGCRAIVRAMPNTPALVGSGATALYAGPAVDAGQRAMAETVMRAVGVVQWLDDEALMDAVTAVSGSGPAYFFLFMEVLERAARHLGLPDDAARLLAVQTAFGAAKMALESDADPGRLRAQVTSAGGTTERALRTLAESGFEDSFTSAIVAARDRSAELAALLGED